LSCTNLDEKIKTNNSFGFFRPYDTEKSSGGVGIEKWHISYSPVSNKLLNDYTLELFKKNINQANILLKTELLQNANFIYEKYVKNIDSSPF